MASYGMNDVKNGMKIIVNGEPCVITDTEYVKPGKGQAFTRIKYRFIKSGRVVELTMKATDSLEAADVMGNSTAATGGFRIVRTTALPWQKQDGKWLLVGRQAFKF